MSIFWSDQLSAGARKITSSAIRDLLKVSQQPDVISFAGGLPAPECFPTEELTAAAERILVDHPVPVLQYGHTEGYPPLREFLVSLMRERGLDIPPEQLLLLSGSRSEERR